MKKLLFFTFLGLVLGVDAQAANNIDVINRYVDTVDGLIGGKMEIIAITIVMIFSGILAWKNASIAPLGWGGAASLAIGASSSIATNLNSVVL